MKNPLTTGDAVVGKFLVPDAPLSTGVLAEYYNQNALEAQENFDANDWADPEHMHAQFRYLTTHLDMQGKSILDVGTGNGLLFSHLEAEKIKIDYASAIDLASEQINILKKLHPSVEAITGDFMTYEFERSFDVVTMFGLVPCVKFIYPGKHPVGSLIKVLDKAIRYAHDAVCFSFLNKAVYEQCEEEGYDYAYFYPDEVAAILTGGAFELSTKDNDLIVNCILHTHDGNDEPFRFNMQRIDKMFGLFR
jgi:SAM-dependent methyltransferase